MIKYQDMSAAMRVVVIYIIIGRKTKRRNKMKKRKASARIELKGYVTSIPKELTTPKLLSFNVSTSFKPYAIPQEDKPFYQNHFQCTINQLERIKLAKKMIQKGDYIWILGLPQVLMQRNSEGCMIARMYVKICQFDVFKNFNNLEQSIDQEFYDKEGEIK